MGATRTMRTSVHRWMAGAVVVALGGTTACTPGGAASVGSQDGFWTTIEVSGFVTSVAPLGDGFVAAQDAGGVSEVIASVDGLVWTAVATGVVGSGEQLSWMTGGSRGAAGEILGAASPEVVSTTDGATFVRADPIGDLGFGDVGILGMAWGPAGLAVVVSRGGEPVGVLLSDDGLSWSAAMLPSVVDLVNPDTTPIAASNQGYVILGVPESDGNPGIQAWSSPDVLQWAPEQISPRFVASIGSPVAWSGGWLTWGTDTASGTQDDESRFIPRAWASDGEGTWRELAVAGTDEPQGLIPVAGSALGVFAVAWREIGADLDVLFSEDLLTWRTWTTRDAFGTDDPNTVMWGAAAVGSDAVVVPVAGDLSVGRP